MTLEIRLETMRREYREAGLITKKTGGKHIEQILEFLDVMRFELQSTQEELRRVQAERQDKARQIRALSDACRESNAPAWLQDHLQKIAGA